MEALVIMRSCFNVDSIMMACWLIDVRKHYYVLPEYELHIPLRGQHHYNAFSSGFGLSIDALKAGLRFLLHPVIVACLEGWQISPSHTAPNSWRYMLRSIPAPTSKNLRKRIKGVAPGQPTGVTGSTTKAPAEKGREPAKIEEVPERGYSIKDLCEVEDRTRANEYFASIMTRLSPSEGKELLTSRWSSIPGSARMCKLGVNAYET
ncbi:hypothetical protein GW17_00059360 [Ensete ventricosum]|nr:hypothetical protein GW17_00059360 [Ensete ventricosum]